MAQLGVAITMALPYRNSEVYWSNQFHYVDQSVGTSDEVLIEQGNAIVDEVVENLKSLHGAFVRFDRARVWSSGGTPDQNEMLIARDLTGNGQASAAAYGGAERAVLVRWYLGRSSRGQRVYLAKWLKLNTSSFGLDTQGVLREQEQISQTNRDLIATTMDNLKNVGPGPEDSWALCSPSGQTLPLNTPAVVYPWLESRDIGDSWRTN